MHNTQPKEKVVHNCALDVHSVWKTMQGEGPFAGWPATFIRLAGCNLDCPGCDTDYTSKRRLYSAREILELTRHHETPKRLVVLTGGEPCRQDLSETIQLLLEDGYLVQLETNGTIFRNLPLATVIICSPKTPVIHPDWQDRITAYKYVLRAGEIDEDGLPTSVLLNGLRPARPHAKYRGPIYVQPLDEQDFAANYRNLIACRDVCLEHGYILCLQLHKIAELP